MHAMADTTLMHTRTEQFRAQHRCQRQCHQAGEADRRGERQGELREQATDIALEQAQRDEDGDQHQRGGDDRKAYLTGAPKSGDQGRLAVDHHAAMNVLDDHDCIIDHEPDRQHQRQQREQVQSEPEQRQKDEGPDQRDRYCYRGHQGRAYVAEKHEDHHHDQPHGNEQCRYDFMQRAGNEHRRVEIERQLHAFG